MPNEKHYPGHVTMSTKIRRAMWNIVCAVLFRPSVTPLFGAWRRFLLCLFGARIAPGVTVYASAKVWAPWNLHMDSGSCLGPGVICYNQDTVTLERGVTVSQDTFLCTASHDTTMLNTADDSLVTAPITLKENAWVGSRAFIGPGVIVGENAIVGATASVFKDVEPMTIVGGNPAKVIKQRVMRPSVGASARPKNAERCQA